MAEFFAEFAEPFTVAAGREAQDLARQMAHLASLAYEPGGTKALRSFSLKEASRFLRVSESDLKAVLADRDAPKIQRNAGRWVFEQADIEAIRRRMSFLNPGYAVGRRPGEITQTIAVANFKGGSAKTTTSVHLAQYLALRGYKVLAIDMDPQGSLTSCFGIQPSRDVAEHETIFGAIEFDDNTRRHVQDLIRPTYIRGLDVIPAAPSLQAFQIEIAEAMAEKTKQEEALQFHLRLKHVLMSVTDDAEGSYDVIVIDCPPQIDFLTTCAIGASTGLIVPLHPQMIDIESYSQFVKMLSELKVLRNFDEQVSMFWYRVLFTRYDMQERGQQDVYNNMRRRMGWRAMPNPMIKTAAIAEAGIHHASLYEMAPPNSSHATYNRAIETMDQVNGDIEGLLLRTWEALRCHGRSHPAGSEVEAA